MSDTDLEDPIYSFSHLVPAPERRQNERYTTTMRVGTMVTDRGRELCLVRNISCGGLRARVYCRVEIGTRATIELKCGQCVSGAVIWAQDDHIGLRFDRPVDVADVLSSATSAARGQKSRLPRIEVNRFATVRDGDRVLRGEAVNISQGGVKLALAETLGLRDVVVAIAGLEPMPGVVRWSDQHHAGVEFNDLIPLKRLFSWSGADGAQEASRRAG